MEKIVKRTLWRIVYCHKGEMCMREKFFIFMVVITLSLTACNQNDAKPELTPSLSGENASSASHEKTGGDDTASEQNAESEISAQDIHSVAFNPEIYTMEQDKIERFLEIIENAEALDEDNPPKFKAGAMPYSFTFTMRGSAEKRSFSINNNILTEMLDDGEVQYYVIDEKNKDYEFIRELCRECIE